VYLSNKKIKVNSIGDDQTSGSDKSDFIKVTSIEESKNQRYYEFTGLEVSTCYYVIITAENSLGEGYKA
jgi:23S rRNA maturation-related 3'-5' exoribonuclease YhaM